MLSMEPHRSDVLMIRLGEGRGRLEVDVGLTAAKRRGRGKYLAFPFLEKSYHQDVQHCLLPSNMLIFLRRY